MSKGRFISILIACAWLWFGSRGGDAHGFLNVLVFLLLPMACIWFGDELGSLVFVRSGGTVNESPGCLVAFMGWLLLLSPIIYFAICFLLNGHW